MYAFIQRNDFSLCLFDLVLYKDEFRYRQVGERPYGIAEAINPWIHEISLAQRSCRWSNRPLKISKRFLFSYTLWLSVSSGLRRIFFKCIVLNRWYLKYDYLYCVSKQFVCWISRHIMRYFGRSGACLKQITIRWAWLAVVEPS